MCAGCYFAEIRGFPNFFVNFADITDFISLNMGLLNFAKCFIPGGDGLEKSSIEGLCNSCQSSATEYDYYISIVICLTILLSLVVIAYCVGYCVRKNYEYRMDELNVRSRDESAKLDKEHRMTEKKDRFDSAWRTISHAWEQEKSEGSVTEHDDPNLRMARTYIRTIWGSESPEVNDNHTGAEA